MGHLVMQRAADTAIALAKQNGVSWVARRSNPCRRGRRLCRDAARARHDRHLLGGRQRQPHGGVGRRRESARHQSDRVCGAGRRRGAGGARYRHHGGLLRHRQGLQAPGQADAGRLDGQRKTAKPITDFARGRKGCWCQSAATRAQGSALVLGLLAGTLNGTRRSAAASSTSTTMTAARATPGHFIIAWTSAVLTDRRLQGPDRPPAARSEIVPSAARLRFHPRQRAAP